MKKAFRIGYNRYFKDEIFSEHIKFIKEYGDVIDEVALFVEYSHHGYWELNQQRDLSKILKRRIKEYKNAGIKSVGLNVLCTIGHIDEAWDVLPKPPMQTMIGIDGKQSRSCLCPSTDEFKQYTSERYKILASSNPDFIWLDDDLRIPNHGVEYPCFCPTCISKFNSEFGFDFTFDTLTDELQNKNNEAVWKAWRKFQDKTYVDLITLIKTAIHSVNSNILTGYMSIIDNDNTNWMETLEAVKGRPGGGFYNDDTPIESLYKALNCGVQISNYPEKITDIQYEFEDFPYQTLAKSMTISNLECIASIMCGCNGIAFNATCFYDYPKLMEMIRKNHLLWETVSKQNVNYQNIGVCFSDFELQIKFAEIGIPIAFEPACSSVFVLTGKDCMRYDDNKIKSILSKNAFIDGETLQILIDRGFSELCGVDIESCYDNGTGERFSDDELNVPFAGYKRDCFATFNKNIKSDSFTLSKINDSCRVLANLETIKHEKLGPCMTAFKNKLGGKVVVSTYFQHDFMKSEEKRRQIQNVFDWLSDGTIPIRIDYCHKVVPFVRQSKTSDDLLILLVNASFDEISDFSVDVRCQADQTFYSINSDGGRDKLQTQSSNNSESFRIGSIPPWEFKVISNTVN